MNRFILGISAFYHDSAAALLGENGIIAAAHEERFTRKKHDHRFPHQTIRYLLDEVGITVSDLHAISFYDKPYLKFERLLETYHAFAPRGVRSFLSAIPAWIKEKLFMRQMLWKELQRVEGRRIKTKPPLLFPEHHLSHAASAFYPSPFSEAAILTIDGVGEWSTTTIGWGHGKNIRVLRELRFPHSLGLLYSAFTYYCGFKVNSGEYKLMGLAPYGNPRGRNFYKYREALMENLVDIRDDGSILLNMDYFDFPIGLQMSRDHMWKDLFGIPRRTPESEITQPYMDMALAIQDVTEQIVLRLAKTAQELTECPNLTMAGGVALNCVASGKLLKEKVFKRVWIQPAAGDAGGSIGAAYAARHIWQGENRTIRNGSSDGMKGAYLGPAFEHVDVRRLFTQFGAVADYHDDFDILCCKTAELLAEGQVIGWFQGRMEMGPRALGNRSILGDPRNPNMQKRLNLKIKYREGFRPFAPSVLAECAADYFDLETSSPYMLIVAPVRKDICRQPPDDYETMDMYERLYHVRSEIPAVTHVDYSARIQTVHRETNERYWKLIKAFKAQTGCGVIVNTSFNIRGEPIVCTAKDAYRCFMRTEMDYLVIGDFLFRKSLQPPFNDCNQDMLPFELD